MPRQKCEENLMRIAVFSDIHGNPAVFDMPC